MVKLVIFDMDGVLADIESSWVYVHRHFGVNNDRSLSAYLRGDITDLEFIRSDIQLWREKNPEVTAAEIAIILDGVPIMPGALEAVKGLRDKGYRNAIVSAGIDLLAQRIARELKIDFYLANGLVVDAKGRLSGEGILRVRLIDKGDAVGAAGRIAGAMKKDIVTVGNSRYDISMFEESGLGVAFCPSDDSVRQRAGAVVEERDLSRIVEVIDSHTRR